MTEPTDEDRDRLEIVLAFLEEADRDLALAKFHLGVLTHKFPAEHSGPT
ncbi:MAG: hypothetical protein ACREEC_07300 [Thermoplasmata archaeon]